MISSLTNKHYWFYSHLVSLECAFEYFELLGFTPKLHVASRLESHTNETIFITFSGYCLQTIIGNSFKKLYQNWTRASCFIRGSKHLETIKALGLRPRAFICFSVFGTPDEILALVFDILLEIHSRFPCMNIIVRKNAVDKNVCQGRSDIPCVQQFCVQFPRDKIPRFFSRWAANCTSCT